MFTMLVADDEYFVRLGIREAIDWQGIGVEIAGEAEDGETALEAARELRPDLVLTDIRMPFMDGLTLMERLKAEELGCGVIILSGFGEFEYAQKAIENGALAYLLKPIDKEALRSTVADAMQTLRRQRSREKYFTMMQQELSGLKQQFLRELLLGAARGEEAVRERLSSLEIPLSWEKNAVVAIRLDNAELLSAQLSPEEGSAFRQAVAEAAVRLPIDSSFMGLCVEMSETEWCLLLSLYRREDDALRSIRERCETMCRALSGRFPRATISVGISEVCETLLTISEACRQARAAAEVKFLPGTNSVTYIGSVDECGCRPEVRDCIRYIKGHYSEDIGVEDAAHRLFLSPSYLMHLLREDLDKTFNTLLTECRIAAAKELLRDPQNKVYEIALRVGYQDAKYFCRLFRKLTGVTPGEYSRLQHDGS